MNGLYWTLIIIVGISLISIIPSSFADHTTALISTPAGTSSPGCETTNECFVPATVSVDVGGTVTWSNDDTAAHTVTSGTAGGGPDGEFDSSLFMAGTTFSHNFNNAGTYPYFCMVHPWMIGTVYVQSTEPEIILDPITVRTNKNSYSDDDTMTISGEVGELLSGFQVSLQIFSPNGNQVNVQSFDVFSDKRYSTQFTTGGPLMRDAGTYIVKVLYGTSLRSAETTFYFSGSTAPAPSPTSESSLRISGTNFSVDYSINGGYVLNAYTDREFNALIIELQATNDGELIIKLPRDIIDAQVDGRDQSFFVLHDLEETDDFEEINTNFLLRTLSIPFSDGTQEIEIIGTSIVGSSPSTTPTTPTPYISAPSPVTTDEVTIRYGTSSPGCETDYTCFKPYAAKINKGGTIKWTNLDGAAHTVTSGTAGGGPDGEFDSSLFLTRKTFYHTFSSSGIYDYFCLVHPWMTGQIFVGNSVSTPTPTPTPTPSPSISLDIKTDSSTYASGDRVNIDVDLSGAGSGENVAISVTDPSGSNLVTRTVSTDSRGDGDVTFKLSDTASPGTYSVIATASVDGKNVRDDTSFRVRSAAGTISIVSISPTDQQGDSVSSFTKGKLGFVKVILNSESSTASLVTVNLFDDELTSLGIGSFKTTLSPGESEMVLSFFIPNDASNGTADVYANVFSDWPSRGGTPLTGESSASVSLR